VSEQSLPVVGLLGPPSESSVREEMAELLGQVPAELTDFGSLPSGPGIAALIVGPETTVDAAAVARLPGLKVVAASSTGFDHVAVDAVTTRGGWVTNVVDYCTEEVADHTLALVLALLRRLVYADRSVRRGEWAAPDGVRRIAGTRLGLIGFGRIGQAVAKRAVALGMVVSAFDPEVSEERFTRVSVRRCTSLAEALSQSDVVSLHVPLTGATRGLLGATTLAQMAPGSFVVNAARGGVVDQAALLGALVGGYLAGAGLDVFAEEPLSVEEPLSALDNVVLTPHIAWESADARRAVFVRAAQCVAAVLRGDEPGDVVGRPYITR
jgi:D-3-phosphoglycerate dehydrogenase / 2-oxoglutarate reductase